MLGCWCAPAFAGENLVLGMSAAFKGASRGLSIELYRGSIAYFEQVNRAGGVHGRPIVLRPLDDGYEPVPAIENTIELIESDDVFLLFDYMGSPTTTRVLPLLKLYHDNRREVFLFFPFTGAQPMRRPPYNEYVFNLRASYHEEAAKLVEHFLAIGRKRIAVFYQIDAYGRAGWDGVRQTLAGFDDYGNRIPDDPSLASEGRLRIVAEATYRRGTKFTDSLSEQVKILRAAKPDAIISVGTYAACAGFIRDVRNAGWNVPIANVSGVDSENLLALLVEEGKKAGKDYATDLINSQVVPSYHDQTLPAVVEYRAAMAQYSPVPPAELLNEPYRAPQYSFISFEGFLNAKLMVQVLNKMTPPLRQTDIRAAAESLENVDLGIDVPISFGPQRHQALHKVYCTVVADGLFVPLPDDGWEKWRP